MKTALMLAAFLVWAMPITLLPFAGRAEAADGLRLVPKPPDTVPETRARRQPSVPGGYQELPFVETAPAPVLSPDEQRRGYLIFQRPITKPVYPNTRPLAHERIERLVAFATPGEFEPVTLSIYPQRDLKNFRVRVSPLEGRAGTISASCLEVRLLTYWNIGYPRYTSRSTYRRLPELLERVNVHSSPAGACQRWWIRIHVPQDTRPGRYRGTVTVWDDDNEQAVAVPLEVHVLGFRLRADPAKHFSTYYSVRNSVQFQGKDEAFIRKATANEYQAMADYGLDMIPTFSLGWNAERKQIELRYPEELQRLMAAGLKGPVPVTGGSVIDGIYRATTPGGRRGSHWSITKMPPPEFYRRVTAAFRAFETARRANGWPEMICCPLDEVAASHQEFGWRVYKAVHDAGIRVYITKNPLAADADGYRPHVDIFCSQPYSMPYEKIAAQDRYEYWCYPNHNAGEIKDRRVMCKGGRMTYGFGFWRSGYTTLIPWHWAWTPKPDPFDYLRGSRSGCGQRIDDDGQVIPAVYWECFREGRDDLRYVYTLQQTAWERVGSTDEHCRRGVAEAQAILQETWDAIRVQQKYLADGMWPAEEFTARRWRLAKAIAELLEFPVVRRGTAPSVWGVDTRPKPAAEATPVVERAAAEGRLESKDLGGDFRAWQNGTKEGRVEVTPAAGRGDQPGLRWQVHVDHNMDGGEGGKYPVGWPRVGRNFALGQLDFTQYDYLELLVRVDSDRDEVADDSTPLGVSIRSHREPGRLFETRFELGDRQRAWIPLRFSIKQMRAAAGVGATPWQSIARLQLFIAESNYRDGTHLVFDVNSIRLLRFTAPVISELAAPRFVLLPRHYLPIQFDVMGLGLVRAGTHKAQAALVDSAGRVRARGQQDLTAGSVIAVDTSDLAAGCYTLRLRAITAGGDDCSEATATVDCLSSETRAAGR